MAAHRYWRLYITSVYGGNKASLKRFRLFSGDTTNLGYNGNGTPMGVYGPELSNTYGPHSAFVGFVMETGYQGIEWNSPSQPNNWDPYAPAWIGWDFGSGNERDITNISIRSSTGPTNNVPQNVALQYSDDATNWVESFSFVGNSGDNVDSFAPSATATFNITSPAPTLVAMGGANSYLSAPAIKLTAFGGASFNLSAPSSKVLSFGGASANITAPRPALISTGHNSYGEQAAFLVAPSPTLTVTTGAHARATAPRPVLSASGTVTTWAKAALTAPSPTLSASGTVSGMASATLASPSPNLVGYGGAVCSVTITGKATLTATGTTGSIGGAALSCPLFELTASATVQNHGSANLLAPSPRMGASAQAWLIAPSAQLTSIGSAVITATYEAYAVNLGHRNPEATTNEVTRYTNFPFTHVVRYQNSYYGASSTGLYLLEGTTDDATPIPWSFKTGITDFDDAKQKTVAAAYFGGSMPPATTVTLFEGDKVGVPYAQTTPRGADLQNYRETFARGVKGRYYALGLSGTGDIELDDLDFEIKQLTRRI